MSDREHVPQGAAGLGRGERHSVRESYQNKPWGPLWLLACQGHATTRLAVNLTPRQHLLSLHQTRHTQRGGGGPSPAWRRYSEIYQSCISRAKLTVEVYEHERVPRLTHDEVLHTQQAQRQSGGNGWVCPKVAATLRSGPTLGTFASLVSSFSWLHSFETGSHQAWVVV